MYCPTVLPAFCVLIVPLVGMLVCFGVEQKSKTSSTPSGSFRTPWSLCQTRSFNSILITCSLGWTISPDLILLQSTQSSSVVGLVCLDLTKLNSSKFNWSRIGQQTRYSLNDKPLICAALN